MDFPEPEFKFFPGRLILIIFESCNDILEDLLIFFFNAGQLLFQGGDQRNLSFVHPHHVQRMRSEFPVKPLKVYILYLFLKTDVVCFYPLP